MRIELDARIPVGERRVGIGVDENAGFALANMALSRGPRVVDDAVKQRLRDILGEIQSGAFAEELFADDEAGRPRFAELRKAGEQRAAEIERVGKELRTLAGVEGLLGVR